MWNVSSQVKSEFNTYVNRKRLQNRLSYFDMINRLGARGSPVWQTDGRTDKQT